MTPDDEKFLRRAVELASQAGASGERPFGSLLVDADGVVLIEDHNTVVSEADITAHPELKLARWAARELPAGKAAGTTMFTSCQPCPMCATPSTVPASDVWCTRCPASSSRRSSPPRRRCPRFGTRGRRSSTRRASRSTTITDQIRAGAV